MRMSDTPDSSNDQAIIQRLMQWGERQRLVRAMLLTSSPTDSLTKHAHEMKAISANFSQDLA